MLSAAPPVVKIVLIGVLVVFFPVVLSVVLVAALAFAPYAVFSGRAGVVASLSVAVWGVAIVTGLSGGQQPWLVGLLVLPFAAVAAAHAGSIGRWFVPCRTVAWTLLWALPVGMLAWHIAADEPLIGPTLAWLLAFVVLGWRLTKSLQDAREFGRQQARGGALAAPHAWPSTRPPRDGRAAGPRRRPLRPRTAGSRWPVTWSVPGIRPTAPAASRLPRRVTGPLPTGRRRSRSMRPWRNSTP